MNDPPKVARKWVGQMPYLAVLITAFWVTIALFGAFTGHDLFKRIFPGAINLLPNTCLGMVLCSGSLLILQRQPSGRALLLGRGLALAVVLLGGGTLLEHALGRSLGIDRLVLHLPVAIYISEDYLRMAIPAATGLSLIAAGLLFQSYPSRRNQLWGHFLQLAACFLGWGALVTPAFGVTEFYGLISYMRISVPTAICLMVLSLGAICAHPGVGLVRMALGDGLAGLMLRALLPAVLILPFASSWLGWWGENAFLYAPNYGDVVSTLATSVLFIVILFYSAKAIETTEASQRAASLLLARSEARYRLLTEGTGDVVWVVDAETFRFTYMSPALTRMHGILPEQLLDQPMEVMMLPHEREELTARARRRVQAHLSGEVPPDHIFIDVIQTYGVNGLIWIEVSFKIRRNEETGRMEIHGVTRDITDRKQNQLALEVRERQLRELLEKSPIPMWLLNGDGDTTFVNERFQALTGYSAQDVPTTAHFWEKAIPAAGKRGAWDLVWQEFMDGLGSEPRHLPARQLEIESAAGETVIVELSAIAGPDYCLISLVDLTEVVKSRRELQLANEKLEKRVRERTAQLEVSNNELLAAKQEADAANQAKSEFLSRMSHELRTPLNAILGFGQILSFHDLGLKDNENVSYILQAGNHLLELINEILDISRIETGRMAMAPEQMDLAAAVGEALDLMQPLAKAQDVKLINALDTPVQVFADPQRLRQVLLNLIANGIKYNRPGGQVRLHLVTANENESATENSGSQSSGAMGAGVENGAAVTLETLSSARVPGEASLDAENQNSETAVPKVRLAVTDTGWGLTATDISRLFVPFERLAAAATSIEGTGIGLVLTQRLIQAMDGAIGVESTPGVGSTFWVELPCLPSVVREEGEGGASLLWGPGKLGTREAPVQSTAPLPQTIFVMYVGNSPANVRLLRSALRRYPCVRLLETEQGSLALDLAGQHHPVFMIVASQLVDMTARELVERLRRQPASADLPVFLYGGESGSAGGELAEFEKLGLAGTLARPLNLSDVEGIFHKYLAASSSPS